MNEEGLWGPRASSATRCFPHDDVFFSTFASLRVDIGNTLLQVP